MKRTVILIGLLLAVFALAHIAEVRAEEEQKTVSLRYKTMSNIDKIFTPGRKKKPLTTSIMLPNGGGMGIACEVSNIKVVVDTNLDGRPDKNVAKNGDIIELVIQKDGMEKQQYAVRITYDDRFTTKQWFYETASAVTGRVAGQTVYIIDDNCNANFADYGEDGLVIGRDDAGWYLSTAVSLGRDLVELSVDIHGEELSYTEFYGDLGEINPFRKLEQADFKPKIFVVRQSDRSFNVLRGRRKLVKVPTGSYNIERGVIDKLTEFVGGKHPPFAVRKDNTTYVEWGGPFTMLFNEAPSKDYQAALYGTSASTEWLKGAVADPHMFYMEPPYIIGEKGEVYVGSKRYCQPEQAIRRPTNRGQMNFFPYPPAKISYHVEIIDRKTKRSINQVKFYTGNQPAKDEQTPAKYFWTPYTFSYGDHRGKYILRIETTATQIFKDAVFEEPIKLE